MVGDKAIGRRTIDIRVDGFLGYSSIDIMVDDKTIGHRKIHPGGWSAGLLNKRKGGWTARPLNSRH